MEPTNLLRARLKLAILALSVLLLGLTPYPRAFTESMRQARDHRTVREYSQASEAYMRAARHDPRSPLPWMEMGEMFLEQHRYLRAAIAFREAERLGSGDAAVLGLGESYAGQGDWAVAMQTWLGAGALNADRTSRDAAADEAVAAAILIALGRGSIAQDQLDQAAGFLTAALQRQPCPGDAATAHRLLGRLLIEDDPDEAAGHLTQAGDGDMLAVLRAASAEPDAINRALLLGAAFLQRDDLPLARHHFQRAVDLAPANAEAHAYLAHVLDRRGETIAAKELLEQALALDPDSALVNYFLGSHHRLVGNAGRAQDALWTALQRDPENAALRVEMAEAYLDLHDYAQAEAWYLAAVDVVPEDVNFHLLLVNFYLSTLYRIEEGGIPAAEALVALAPEDARAYDLLGWAYHLAGNQIEAHEALAHALALDPGLVSAQYHLGSLYVTTGRDALARQHLQRVVDLDTGGYFRRRAEALLLELE